MLVATSIPARAGTNIFIKKRRGKEIQETEREACAGLHLDNSNAIVFVELLGSCRGMQIGWQQVTTLGLQTFDLQTVPQ